MTSFTSVRKRQQSKHKKHRKSLAPKAAKIGWVRRRGGWHLFFGFFFCSSNGVQLPGKRSQLEGEAIFDNVR